MSLAEDVKLSAYWEATQSYLFRIVKLLGISVDKMERLSIMSKCGEKKRV